MLRSVRFASFSAIAGALWGIALTPPMAAVWTYDPPFTLWARQPWVERTFGPSLESAGALSFEWAEPYEVYGKGFFLVYLSMIPITRLVHERYRSGGGASRWELWTWRVMWVSLIVAAAGDFVSYWGYSVPDPVGENLWGSGFMFETLAAAVLFVSTTIYGVIALRHRIVPVWASVLLIAVIPLAALTLTSVVAYIPNGWAVPLSIIWASVGAWLLFQPREAAIPV